MGKQQSETRTMVKYNGGWSLVFIWLEGLCTQIVRLGEKHQGKGTIPHINKSRANAFVKMYMDFVGRKCRFAKDRKDFFFEVVSEFDRSYQLLIADVQQKNILKDTDDIAGPHADYVKKTKFVLLSAALMTYDKYKAGMKLDDAEL